MERTLTIARTMGVVTFSLLNLFFSIEAKDERQSAFSLDTFADRTFIITTGVSFFLLVMSTVLRPFQAILKTTTLDVRQWLLRTAVALSIIAAAETRKAVRRAGRPPLKPALAAGRSRDRALTPPREAGRAAESPPPVREKDLDFLRTDGGFSPRPP
jgi:hypothetical protein